MLSGLVVFLYAALPTVTWGLATEDRATRLTPRDERVLTGSVPAFPARAGLRHGTGSARAGFLSAGVVGR